MLIDTINLELFSHTDYWKQSGRVFLYDRFFMLRDFRFRGRDFLLPSQPYLLQEGRVVLVKRGAASYSFNLVEHHFEAGDLVVFFADTLIEKQGISDDFEFDAFSFSNTVGPATDGSTEAFVRLHLDQQTSPVVTQYFDLLWNMAAQSPFPRESVKLMVSSLLLYVRQKSGQSAPPRPANRHEELLRRFVSLVSQHAARERNVPFYASQLCLEPHYLSTLIRQTSGRTVMQWINETAVKELKVWLAYSDDTAAQIAHRFNFPCPASLSKFFKRETGLTPGQYRANNR